MINIVVNGKQKELEAEISLQDLLSHLNLPSRRIAIELNRDVVQRKNWNDVTVSDNDRLEIIHFVGGG